jgi:hypothetical protein
LRGEQGDTHKTARLGCNQLLEDLLLSFAETIVVCKKQNRPPRTIIATIIYLKREVLGGRGGNKEIHIRQHDLVATNCLRTFF